jgi:PIN domain nuclease of toxin-antitoxin system
MPARRAEKLKLVSSTAKRYVLDAFALMALFQEEPGAARVQSLIAEAESGEAELFMTVVNIGEVVYGLDIRRGTESAVLAIGAIDDSPIVAVAVDQSLAIKAAEVKASTGMGYLDSFVVALAGKLEATVVTGDPDFEKATDVQIEWLFRPARRQN